MSMTDYPAVLEALYPDAEWSLNGVDYAGLTWLSDTPKPSKKTLDDAWPQVKYDREYAAVQQARQTAYQQTTDPIFFDWQRGEATEQDWHDAVQAVKDAHPYPVAP
jgi:hypothetical protein